MDRITILFIIAITSTFGFAQNRSKLQSYTPSKLLKQGQWDVKWFNGLYTQTVQAGIDGTRSTTLRSNFLTSTADVFTGVSANNRLNVGVILEYRSNTFGGKSALSVFNFDGRTGLSTVAPAIKFQPIGHMGNFSIQSSIHIPTYKLESNARGFLDQKAWNFQNKLFYDYSFGDGDWSMFADFTLEYHFGDESSFANNTYVIAPSVFVSYFPTSKATLLGFVQQSSRFGDFTQDYTAVGVGGKYQVSHRTHIEALYTRFLRGRVTGLGQTYSMGMRVLM